jgi:hypothetical protein
LELTFCKKTPELAVGMFFGKLRFLICPKKTYLYPCAIFCTAILLVSLRPIQGFSHHDFSLFELSAPGAFTWIVGQKLIFIFFRPKD